MNHAQFDYHQETGYHCTEENSDESNYNIFTNEYVRWLEERYGELTELKEQIRNLLKDVKL